MVASSLLLSVRSDASRRRRFGDVVLLAEAVMNPSVRGVLLAEGYLKRSSLKLKGHRECRLFGIAKSLAIGLDGRMTLSWRPEQKARKRNAQAQPRRGRHLL